MYLQTGIHLAASSNDVETINLLMSLGADCNKQDKFGETPFIKAAKYGHIQALTSLLDSCKRPDLAGIFFQIILYFAVVTIQFNSCMGGKHLLLFQSILCLKYRVYHFLETAIPR